MCICGVMSGFSFSVPSLASVFAISFPNACVCSYFVYVNQVRGPIYLVYDGCYE